MKAALVAVMTVGALGGTTALVHLLGRFLGVAGASAVYLLAVVIVGAAFGSIPAAVAAIAAFLPYTRWAP